MSGLALALSLSLSLSCSELTCGNFGTARRGLLVELLRTLAKLLSRWAVRGTPMSSTLRRRATPFHGKPHEAELGVGRAAQDSCVGPMGPAAYEPTSGLRLM